MTFTETDVCQTCGRLFQSNAYAPPPAFNPERTQMLTLTHPIQTQPTAPEQDSPHYIEPSLPARATPAPLILILVAVTLSLAAFAWLLVR